MIHEPSTVHCGLPSTDATDVASPRVSVVVIGRNEGERLTRCLASVRRALAP